MERAEKVKTHLEKLKQEGDYREQLQINEDDTGHSYDKVFSRFLDATVHRVEVDDPYIRSPHQVNIQINLAFNCFLCISIRILVHVHFFYSVTIFCQCDNFLRFVELCLRQCPNLKVVFLTTKQDEKNHFDQKQRLDTVARSVLTFNKSRKIQVQIHYSDVLHDREIR